MKQTVIGLAGHIDHGKTALVKALTGINTDHLSEEKKRGMTIDIGFAFLTDNITLIDVPGHEKFVKNMMAGVSSIDIALLVVAADDGIMPQTREHFEILNLLNIPKTVIAINKVDLADADWLELVELDLIEMCKGTFMEDSPMVRVSAEKELGINELRKLLIEQSELVPEKNDRGIFRQNVDRVFSKKGYGTVVTGTVNSGKLKVGEKVEIIPSGKMTKVRSLQSHGKEVSFVQLGDRAAINLKGIEKNDINRGDQLATPGFFKSVEQIGVKINLLSSCKSPIIQNQRIRIHLGTRESMARIALINKKKLNPGNECSALIRLEAPMVASKGDKFIIRSYSPVLTIGGGIVLENHIEEKWRIVKDKIQKLSEQNELQQLVQLVEQEGANPLTLQKLQIRLGISDDKIHEWIKNEEKIFWLSHKNGKWVLSHQQWALLIKNLEGHLMNFHENNPLKSGVQKEELRQQMKCDDAILDILLQSMLKDGMVIQKGKDWHLASFSIKLSQEDLIIQTNILNLLDREGFTSSSLEQLSKKMDFSKDKIMSVLNVAEQEGKLLRIDGNLMFTKRNFIVLKDKVLHHFLSNDILSVPGFKELAQTSRKYAVPLLEYFDKKKITYRDGNDRKLVK